MSAHRTPRQTKAWLDAAPTLGEMREAYPEEWAVVERELMAVVDSGDSAQLTAYVRGLARPAAVAGGARAATPGLDARLAAIIRQRMAAEAVRGLGVAAATGVTSGTVRFGKVNGSIIQGLLFSEGLTRKPVPLKKARRAWPMLKERGKLMPLVQPKGIYCFYSDRLVEELAALIGERQALEIAAGDGTLTRFLRDAGASVIATDDHSWKDVAFPSDVERLDARKALKQHRPQVVLCSWPPAGNAFEAGVFQTASVETYVVIGNRHIGGWGNHHAYAEQDAFDRRDADDLAALMWPPELESVVYVFERRR